MLSLLGGLLFRPRSVIEEIIRNPKPEQASRLTTFLIILVMINTVFLTLGTPEVSEMLSSYGGFQWVLILLLPPFLFYFQRWLNLLYVRLGLFFFARKHLPQDKGERQELFNRLKAVYPYVIYPSILFTVISLPIQSQFVNIWFFMMGLTYLLFLMTVAIKTLYNVSTGVALLGPVFVQFIVVIIATFIAVVLLAATYPALT